MHLLLVSTLTLLVAACATREPAPALATPADAFFERLLALCGNAYAGRLGAHDASDLAAFGGTPVMHVRECSADEIRIPFHVGDDRSRTWVITRGAKGLRLKHQHRHADGSPDAIDRYGGDSAGPGAGSASRQEFPADAESKAMFAAAGMQASIGNTWAIEVESGTRFAYELRRANRHFSVEFDLSAPVAPPPPPWGSEAAQ
ncbi:MAG: hypothetical protein EOP90_13395 [Lysobacteraceae bacterium]|nr:MAG: hypothetical protein EOP90_13395 [Xanthomonadaceae bacterium]